MEAMFLDSSSSQEGICQLRNLGPILPKPAVLPLPSCRPSVSEISAIPCGAL